MRKSKKLFAYVMTTAMVMSLFSGNVVTRTNVDAATVTSTVLTEDFETGGVISEKWTKDVSSESSATFKLATNSYNTVEGGSNSLNLWINSASDYTGAYQTVDLDAGDYTISYYAAGEMPITWYVVDSEGKEVMESVTDTIKSGWQDFGNNTHKFTLNEDVKNAKIGFKVTGTAGAWGYLDDIKVAKETEVADKEYSLDELKTLVEKANDTDLSMCRVSNKIALNEMLSQANTLISEGSKDSEAIGSIYKEIESALNNLVLDEKVFVRKVKGLTDSTIRGIDISSFESIMKSFEETGGSYKDWNGNVLDRQGFFNLLKDAGVNYVRIRVWNNPFDSEGNGYGGGNNDIEAAKTMGQYATKAGLKVLIDFHYSDFWADPGKQKAPKAWSDYTTEEKENAISTYTKESLNTLIDAGVDVAMVQVGNETTNSFCGVSRSQANSLFDAGCDAVHEVAQAHNTKILATVHFTNPECAGNYANFAKTLADYDGDGDGVKEGVSYDVFASSYYPYWHGTIENLTSVLKNVAETYDKYVMVAETSWATTLDCGDGHDNTVRQGSNSSNQKYDFSVQGQANEVRDVFTAGANIGTKLSNGDDAFLGVFYWEGAWIPVESRYDVFNQLKSNADDIYASNKTVWEKYGSGWASSYAGEYDANDAGKWYGGSAVDNQSFFDFNGYPLDSLNVFKYVLTGSDNLSTEVKNVKNPSDTNLVVGDKLTLPSTIEVTYTDNTTEELNVTWDQTEVEKVNSGVAGSYTITGKIEGVEALAKWNVTVENVAIVTVENPADVTVTQGGEITLPESVKATYNNNTSADVSVIWNGSELMKAVMATAEGEYQVTGTVEGTDKTVTWKINIESNDKIGTDALNKNGDFETVATAGGNNATMENWTFEKGALSASTFLMVRYSNKINTHSGKYALMCGVNNSATATPSNCEGTAYQTIEGLEVGTYQYSGYLKEAAKTGYDVILYAYTYKGENDESINYNNAPYKREISLTTSYDQYKLKGIKVSEGETLVVGFYYKNEATYSYVAADDFVLNKIEEVSDYSGSNITKVVINKNATINVGKDIEVPGDVTVENAGIITNLSNLTVKGKISNSGVISSENKGKIVVEKGGLLITTGTVNSNVENQGTIDGTIKGTVSGEGTYNHAKEPTTEAPTTKEPETQAPTTEVPTTKEPETQASTTQALTTKKQETTQKKVVKVEKAQVKTVIKKKSAKKLTVDIKKVNGAKGYLVQVSTSKKFTKKKTVNVNTTKLKVVVKKLKANKKYYVRVKAYKVVNKSKVYGKWSAVKKVKFK